MDDSVLKQLLATIKTIAIVGLSDNPDRPSFTVASYLKNHGYTIIPINPKYESVLGEKSYPDLISAAKNLAPLQIEIVDLFRRSEDVLPHILEAIPFKPKIIWMQEGVEHHDGAKKAQEEGIEVVMNKCLRKEHIRLFNI